ncbi:hypothetical protein AM1_F0050 (plasmid) [Acaryochloris marina MBIC11017]|uniref:Uncharacterized protein n=1 Tax=Acaryochloris marina (strain MBIC 11017) TaxID=329726 RepID=A8ZQ34_ACAM1|nr:hypothetical protein AM1_F0050 [Acaryochloris marina MBIC11017]
MTTVTGILCIKGTPLKKRQTLLNSIEAESLAGGGISREWR